MTLPAARELGRFGIRVVSIAPGVFETPMMQAAAEEQRQAFQAQIPFPPRFGRPEEFAALVEHVLRQPRCSTARSFALTAACGCRPGEGLGFALDPFFCTLFISAAITPAQKKITLNVRRIANPS